MVKTYTKLISVEAIQWSGDNTQEVIDFIGEGVSGPFGNQLMVMTRYGELPADQGDYIVKQEGAFYPRSAAIFELAYSESVA